MEGDIRDIIVILVQMFFIASNLAFMPKGTKEAFIRMRNYTGEAQDLYRGGGIRYGNSPYYNKSKANTHHIKFKNEA